MSKANEVMTKIANAAKVKKFMAQGLSYDDAYKKAYPQQGPKDKGVIDPARPDMPKQAAFGALAKALTGAGRVAQKAAPVAAKATKGVVKATDRAARQVSRNVGNTLLGFGSKNKRVVRLPDGKLWHPSKAGLAATNKSFKRKAMIGGALGAAYLANKKSEPKSYREKAYLGAGQRVEILPGQTLSEIAHQHQTTPAQLQQMNQIEDANYIRAGETLRVPSNLQQPQAPTPGLQSPQNPTNPTLKEPKPQKAQWLEDVLKKQGSLSKEAFIGNFTKGLGYGAKYLKGLKGLQSAGTAAAKKADDIAPKLLDKQKGGKILPDGRLSPEAIKAHNKAVAESGKFPNKHIKGVGEVGKPGVAGKDYPLPKQKPGWGLGGSSAPVPAGNVGADPKYTHPLKELYKSWGLD